MEDIMNIIRSNVLCIDVYAVSTYNEDDIYALNT